MSIMRSTFSILFYIKKSALQSNGKASIMARITLNGEIAQFSLKCEVEPEEWNPRAQRVNGKSANAVKLNGLLDNSRSILFNHYREINEKEITVSAEKVKMRFLV
jgi:intein/homing endonuclease